MDLCIIITAKDLKIPAYTEEGLFLHFKNTLLEYLDSQEIIYFGQEKKFYAGENEKVFNGTYFKVIAPANLLGLSTDSTSKKIVESFKNIIAKENLRWGTVIIEKDLVKTETIIEFIF